MKITGLRLGWERCCPSSGFDFPAAGLAGLDRRWGPGSFLVAQAASVNAEVARPESAAPVATKGGVRQLTKAMAIAALTPEEGFPLKRFSLAGLKFHSRCFVLPPKYPWLLTSQWGTRFATPNAVRCRG